MRGGLITCAVLAYLALAQCSTRVSPTPPSATAPPTCLRPTDAQGRALYETVRGQFVEARVDQGGGYYLVIRPSAAAGQVSVVVTRDVYDAIGTLQPSRMITLFAYVSSATAGASPPFSCGEA